MSTKTQEYRHPDTKAVPARDLASKRKAPRKPHKPRGHEQIDLINVLFIGSKVKVMQRLIAEVPEEPEGR